MVLAGALVVARTCGSSNQQVTKEEAIEIAKENAVVKPCGQPSCVLVRFVQRGIPVRGYWLVGLRNTLDEDDPRARAQSLLVDVQTGAVSAP